MSQATPGYRPQLDGLRAVAVSLVLVHHFWPDLHPVVWHAGHLGVRLFFVLSGFLITAQLLAARTGAANTGPILRRFYWRRAWRLLPAYYACLFVMLALDAEGIRGSAGWHLAHLSNIHFAWNATWDPWVANHFWSLAVEEQFYLLWPAILLALPVRALPAACLAGLAIGPLFRLLGAFLGWNDMAMLGLLPASLDALAAGCLLAVVGPSLPGRGAGPAGFALLLFSLALPFSGEGGPLAAALPDLLALPFLVWLVARADRGFGGVAGRLLQHPWPVGLGRISYGVYLWHPLLLWGAGQLGERTGWWEQATGPWGLALLAPLSIALAALSWVLIERPSMRLRDRWDAGRTAVGGITAPPPSLPGGDRPHPRAPRA
ncbi:MAG TPA: acyltransferase [Azospirillaceae bacterium]|nr:acyltransferase [Azospirillaceae bacterium]